ncbi:MAG TPA: type II toxin-antitoxin system VapC family toxin [Thermoanaerobaculia bacterium]
MAGRYLLDTNIVIALFDSDPRVQARLAASEEILLSSVVLGELWYGAMNSGNPPANLAKLEGFAASCRSIGIDDETARTYDSIKADLRKSGRPIPENDLWIAASARQHGLVLVTRDGHFDTVEQLTIERW